MLAVSSFKSCFIAMWGVTILLTEDDSTVHQSEQASRAFMKFIVWNEALLLPVLGSVVLKKKAMRAAQTGERGLWA